MMPSIRADRPGPVLVAHPRADEIAGWLRAAANDHLPRLQSLEYRLVQHSSNVLGLFSAPSQVVLISYPFFLALGMGMYSNLSAILKRRVIILDGNPPAAEVMRAMNSGAQGWFAAPRTAEEAVGLLWRLHALLSELETAAAEGSAQTGSGPDAVGSAHPARSAALLRPG